MIEQTMFNVYEEHGKSIQVKLQQLYSTLDRIAKLEAELMEFRNALGMLYQDIQHND